MLFMHMALFTYNKAFPLLLATCLCTIFMSCGEHYKVKKIISDFTASEIILPDELECIYKKQVRNIVKDTLKPYKYIIYYDSYDCSSCRIANLTNIYPLYSFADTNNISVLTIFSPKEEDIDNVTLQLIISDLDIPIYIDVNNIFQKQNPSIPRDLRFHCFLLNNDGKPLLVGNPITSDRIMRLLQTLTYNINNQQQKK